MQSSVDPEYQRMNKERSQAAAARNRTLQVPISASALMHAEMRLCSAPTKHDNTTGP